MEYRDYYRTLELDKGASADDIKRAYRRLARKYHPDVSTEPNAEERFKSVAEAYEVLKDPEKRAAYDRLGSNWKAGEQFTPPPNWGEGFGFQGFGDLGGRGDDGLFSEFFESLFGGQGPRPQRRSTRPRPRARTVRAELSLNEAYSGTERRVTVDGRTFSVKIPAGVTAGKRIRIGSTGAHGKGPDAEVLIEVALAKHPWFEAEGADVKLELPVAPWEAALGATVAVPTLGGKVEMRIPAGSRSGQRLRLKGRGLGAKDKGDQIVTLRLVTPPAATPEEKAFYERMAETFAFDARAELGAGA